MRNRLIHREVMIMKGNVRSFSEYSHSVRTSDRREYSHCVRTSDRREYFAKLRTSSEYSHNQLMRLCMKGSNLFDMTMSAPISISGKHASNFVERYTVSDVNNLQYNQSVYSLLMLQSGGILDEVRILKEKDNDVLMILSDERGVSLTYLESACKEWVSQKNDVKITKLPMDIFSLQGPGASTILRSMNSIEDREMLFNEWTPMESRILRLCGKEIRVTRCGRLNCDGYELLIPRSGDESYKYCVVQEILSHVNCKLSTLSVYDALRLEAGNCRYGIDIDETTTPCEARLEHLIDESRKTKPKIKFMGYNTVISQLTKKTPIDKMRVLLRMDKNRCPKRDETMYDKSTMQEIGYITSGILSPNNGMHGIGMGYVTYEPYMHSRCEVLVNSSVAYIQ